MSQVSPPRSMSDVAALADRAAETLSGMNLESEVYLEDSVISSVTVSGGRVESLEMKEERGAGIRVFNGGRVGFAYTADLSPAGVKQAALAAKSFGAETDADPATRLPKSDGSGSTLYGRKWAAQIR